MNGDVDHFTFTYKKKYNYSVYWYSSRDKALSTLGKGIALRLTTHDQILHIKSSGITTFLLQNSSVLQLGEGDSYHFETIEAYRAWLQAAKFIRDIVSKWSKKVTVENKGIECISLPKTVAEILIICSKLTMYREWKTYVTLDDIYVVTEDDEVYYIFDSLRQTHTLIKG